ncbi:MAG: OB-fold nucleic acid binding domain-containing protein [Candidatus Hodarchaeales archaeon]|jgi:hypothetical protein
MKLIDMRSKKIAYLAITLVVIIISFVLWWDGMTPLTPITKISSIEPVASGVYPLPWPDKVWVKGRVIRSSRVGFTIDDGTGTIGILADNSVGTGQYVVVRGDVTRTGSRDNDNLVYPGLVYPDVHIVLFFQTETHLMVVTLIFVITGVISTSIYLYRKNNSK